ncbi:MAG: adenylate/guanylate cyclase domain-containing protein [Verrucomicrobia bacterium]|nr:adenylate/guanylate cyclase domain-containing protein [Verrucomicrobiota bacterium]
MTEPQSENAWLEGATGERYPVSGNCSLGRAPGNDIPLADSRVSRRHAIIHAQGENEFWLVDLGSSNGTAVNARRVSQPVRLRDGDRVRLGPFELTFRQPADSSSPATRYETTQQTVVDVRPARYWLLLADIVGSTALNQSLPPDQLAVLVGRWFHDCRELIESRGGVINKYLGDGFFAYWPETSTAAESVVAALAALRSLQAAGRPAFRLVAHFGQVFIGGARTQGEESLSGPEVNFVFRAEKVAGGLGERRWLSEAAAKELKGLLPIEPAGEHPVPGFAEKFAFFRF